jgi:hypothetical protein
MTKTWLITGAGRGMGVGAEDAAAAVFRTELLTPESTTFRELSTTLAHEDAKAAA